MKRLREAEAAEGAPRDDADADPTVGAAAKPAAGAAAADAGDAGAEGPAGGGDAAPAAPPVEMRACPFLDTVSRASLDFDFEPRCSVTLSPLHVYACLVCGRYYQGRGPSTPAFAHALEAGHHVYMHLQNGRVFCLPDGYEVLDRSLDDVRQVLQPRFSPADVAALDAAPRWSRALDGCDFLPGCVGLNNLRATDYAAASLQALLRVRPLRDALLLRPARAEGPGADSDLVVRLCGLARKVWNPRAFKGHVSPHELMQAVVAASGKRFRIEAQGDPVEFVSWLLHTLHRDLGGTAQPGSSVVSRAFQGALRVVTRRDGCGAAPPTSELVPFTLLGLDLPPAPLFADALEKNIIPQVSLHSVLAKYDGVREAAVLRPPGRRTYALASLPPYLVLHVKRFTKNAFFVEKNPTLVTFPLRGLDLRDAGLPLPPAAFPCTRYDLVATVSHEGRPGEGAYRAHVLGPADGLWYDVHDLAVAEALPQQVALTEAYLQVWKRCDV